MLEFMINVCLEQSLGERQEFLILLS